MATALAVVLTTLCSAQVAKSDPPKDSLEAKLYEAVAFGRVKEVEDLIKQGANVNTPTTQIPNPMFCVGGDNTTFAVIAKLLIDAGVNLHTYDSSGNILLTSWAIRGTDSTVLLKFLLEQGLDPNELDRNGLSPLFYAASGRFSQIEPLVKAGAKPYLKTKGGLTPMDIFRRQVDGMIEMFIGSPDASRRDEVTQSYLDQVNPYLKILDPKATPYQLKGPKHEPDGYVFNPMSAGGNFIERKVRYENGQAKVDLTFKDQDRARTITIEGAMMRWKETTTKLPIVLEIPAKSARKITLEFPAPQRLDAVMDVFLTDSLNPGYGLMIASDQFLSPPSFRLNRGSESTEPSPVSISSTSNVRVRILEVKVDGKRQTACDGAEFVFERKTFTFEVPGLLAPAGVNHTEIVFEFRHDNDRTWRRSTVRI